MQAQGTGALVRLSLGLESSGMEEGHRICLTQMTEDKRSLHQANGDEAQHPLPTQCGTSRRVSPSSVRQSSSPSRKQVSLTTSQQATAVSRRRCSSFHFNTRTPRLASLSSHLLLLRLTTLFPYGHLPTRTSQASPLRVTSQEDFPQPL